MANHNLKRAVHLAGQEMPGGVLVTVPPGSARTVSLKELGLGGAGDGGGEYAGA